MPPVYVGRFAPSPSGPLHAGSLVAALASYLDARAARGRWLLRIEDIDTPRVVSGAAQHIMQQLQALGLQWDDEPVWQSQRHALYRQTLDDLNARGLLYPCGCTRREIADSVIRRQGTLAAGERPYPGTCRTGLPPGRQPRAWRVRLPDGVIDFSDRWLGAHTQDVAHTVGDIIVRRADGLWAYQLAVVVDDAAQGVTDVVRGADLLSSTARQILLGRLLGLPPLRYLHVPLIRDEASGLKLSKQNGAPALDTSRPLAALQLAWQHLGFAPLAVQNVSAFLLQATEQWAQRWPQKMGTTLGISGAKDGVQAV